LTACKCFTVLKFFKGFESGLGLYGYVGLEKIKIRQILIAPVKEREEWILRESHKVKNKIMNQNIGCM